MIIRKTTMEDLNEILDIYAYAREQMRKNGNPTQWGNHSPAKETIIHDIEEGNSYVLEENQILCGVFSFIIGDDITYHYIEGKWLNDEPYGTIHRVASNGKVKGIFEKCLDYCEAHYANIRVDTHENNHIMQHLLEKNGYQKCGIIYVEDGTPRIAYQKCKH